MTNRFLDYKRKQQPKEKPTLLLFTGQDGSRLQDLTGVSTRQVYTLNYSRLSVERKHGYEKKI